MYRPCAMDAQMMHNLGSGEVTLRVKPTDLWQAQDSEPVERNVLNANVNHAARSGWIRRG